MSRVLDFWFQELNEKLWFGSDAPLDRRIRAEFGDLHAHIASLDQSRFSGARTLLAAIIVTDQFPRNMYRDTPDAYMTDALARALSEQVIALGLDRHMTPAQRHFVYLPFEHSENPEHQALAVRLVEALGDKSWTSHAHWHQRMIQRFGRFPHRNQALNRTSTEEELEYLAKRRTR